MAKRTLGVGLNGDMIYPRFTQLAYSSTVRQVLVHPA